MKIKSQILRVSLRVIVLFLSMIVLSFLSELDAIRWFLGDCFCTGNVGVDVCPHGYRKSEYLHGFSWHWGLRHWLLMVMGVGVSIVQFVFLVKDEIR